MRAYCRVRPLLAGMIFCASGAVAASPAAAPTVAAFGQVEPGQWQLREVGSTTVARTICITDPDKLVQYQHVGAQCTRFVVDDQPRTATIHYTCPGAGHGRTTIRLETQRSFHLDTQGIAGGAPFDMGFEARRIGTCEAAAR